MESDLATAALMAGYWQATAVIVATTTAGVRQNLGK